MQSYILIYLLFQVARGGCAETSANGEATCDDRFDSSALLQARTRLEAIRESSYTSEADLLEEADIDEADNTDEADLLGFEDSDVDHDAEDMEADLPGEVLLGVSSEIGHRSGKGSRRRRRGMPDKPAQLHEVKGYSMTKTSMCAEGTATVRSYVDKHIATLDECAAHCNSLNQSSPPCTAFQYAAPYFRCYMYSYCSKLKDRHYPSWTFFNRTAPLPPTPAPPIIRPTPAPTIPAMPAGCANSHEVKQSKLHVSTLCLPENIAGPILKNIFLGASPMSQVPDKKSADTIYFSWTADREWGRSDTNGMDGRIYISKVRIAKGEAPSLIKSTPFDGFVRSSGIDITNDGVVGTLCAKYFPQWIEAAAKAKYSMDMSPMPLAMCEAHSSDMSRTANVPWQVGKQFEKSIRYMVPTAGWWGTYPLSSWFPQRSAGYGNLAYAPSSNTWNAWYGANVGGHTGYAIHTYVADGKTLTAKDPQYVFFHNPIPTDQIVLKAPLLKPPGAKHNGGDGTETKPAGFEDVFQRGTGDHQAGSAWRYHPLLKDIGWMKHSDENGVYMQMHALSTPKGKFIGRSRKGMKRWFTGHKWGRLELKGEFGNVKQEGGMRPCGRDWITAVVAEDGNACLKIAEDGKFIKRTIVDSNVRLTTFGSSMARIAPLGTSEETALCGASARFLFGYETKDKKKWLVEVDGDCNVKSDTKLDVTASTHWPLHQDWSTTIDGAVFWVSTWHQNGDSPIEDDNYGLQAHNKHATFGPLYGKTPGAHNKAKITMYFP